MNKQLRIFSVGVAVLALIAGLTACTTAPATDEEVQPVRPAIVVQDAWIKTAEEGMTPAFATLTNTTDADINVVSVSTEASAVAELHETVEDESGTMVMRPVEGGFVIPAGATFELLPAGNHVMLMDLVGPVVAGAEVTFTLGLADGTTVEFTAVGKDYSGANESYVPNGDMDMSD